MNALDMKLESTAIVTGFNEKSREENGRKCNKPSKKKNNPFDKDAPHYGLRCESGQESEQDIKLEGTSSSCLVKKRRVKKPNPCENGKMLTKAGRIQDRLNQSLSEESKKKIGCLLNDIKALSDVEKLFLYLKLPSGSSADPDPLKQKSQNNPLGKKADEEGTLAVTWIQSHLEEDPDVSLPKQEVYDEYKSFCEVTRNEPLCSADFGKVMKQIFPSVKPRRLGTRGNSRYCYSGLRKKFKVQAPSLPDLQTEKENCKCDVENLEDEVTSAACHLLFEWTEKLLGTKFTSLKDLAVYLIENMCVDKRSVAAFTVMSESSHHLDKGPYSGNVRCENSKKSETQMHLQRKIQEKELIKEQKKKLQEQRSHITSTNEVKCSHPKKKNQKGKKCRLPSIYNLFDADGSEDLVPTEDSVLKAECTTAEGKEAEQCNVGMVFKDESKQSLLEMNAPNSLEGNAHDVSNHTTGCLNKKAGGQPSPSSGSDTEECGKKKKSGKVAISQSKTPPVCISQSLPGFIIVPSLSQVQIAEISSKVSSKPLQKYKRIQPKPINDCGSSPGIRSRAGSVGSVLRSESKSHVAEGRRSSHAWLQSDTSNSQELNEDQQPLSVTNIFSVKNSVDPSVFLNLSPVKQELNEQKSKNRSPATVKSEGEKMNPSHVDYNLDDKCSIQIDPQSNASCNLNDEHKNSENQGMKDGLAHIAEVGEDYCAVKRPSDEGDSQVVASKRPHLEELLTSEISGDSLSPWSKDAANAICHMSSVLVRNPANIPNETDLIENGPDDQVSVHELESDALIEYLHGNDVDSAQSDFTPSSSISGPPANSVQSKSQEHFIPDSGSEQTSANHQVKQLSQLRMLLEKNLPQRAMKGTTSRLPVEKILLTNKSSSTAHPNVVPLNDKNTLEGNVISVQEALMANKLYLNKVGEFEVSVSNNQLNISKSSISSPASLLQIENTQTSSNDLSPQEKVDHEFLSLVSSNYISDSFAVNEPLLINVEATKELSRMIGNYDNNQTSSPMAAVSDMELSSQQLCHPVRNSAQTQVPSVPPSPNTRRRAFNFQPISPRNTPISEVVNPSGTPGSYSPIPSQLPRSMASIGVGPSQPPSAAGSPFVSPRSTPVPLARSRHSSGQSTYSTSRHTPFQNFDSGVSSISTSPFISPQPTPVPVSRLRHNSSHGPGKTVTFSTINNPQVIHTQPSLVSHGPLRSRHSSSPGGPHLTPGSLLSPRSAPLSPLVGENYSQTFTFPSVNESLNNSGSSVAPLSPVSEQLSLSSNCANSSMPELTSSVGLIADTGAFINENARNEMIGLNALGFKQKRQRHCSSSVIQNKPSSFLTDSLSQEVQFLLKNQPSAAFDSTLGSRSRSVPLHQMLRTLRNYTTLSQTIDDTGFSKSHPTTPLNSQSFCFPMRTNQVPSSLSMVTVAGDCLSQNRDKNLVQPLQSDWPSMDATSDLESSSARRNISSLLETPLGDDLQTTLDDLRDCDNDFSKFAQELEDMSQNEEATL